MISDEIRRLHELHQAGALSDAEFEQAKAKVLSGSYSGNAAGGAGPRVNLNKGASEFKAGCTVVETQLRALRRSRTDRWIGGVCGGLNGVLGIEAWVWRLVFVLFTLLTSGFGALVYLLMWIFVPEE
ncbi:PspC domain-containing protein [Massilia sp.]|uniref:PspC domain-containing protein n=1 Tax=Massilia sp. TaxID=1882437 RepID=UPI00289C175B|nr:PspC domain-containing protein [Massilia sp.]